MPGTALDEAGKDRIHGLGRRRRPSPITNASIDGPASSASGKGKGSFAKKADIEGGFQIQSDRTG